MNLKESECKRYFKVWEVKNLMSKTLIEFFSTYK